MALLRDDQPRLRSSFDSGFQIFEVAPDESLIYSDESRRQVAAYTRYLVRD